jgi:hypothetical protein
MERPLAANTQKCIPFSDTFQLDRLRCSTIELELRSQAQRFRLLLARRMNDIIDKVILSAPLALALVAGYFVFRWKPRQANREGAARTEIVFWSVMLTVLVLVGVYAGFFRR